MSLQINKKEIMADPWRFSDFPSDVEDVQNSVLTLNLENHLELPLLDEYLISKLPDLNTFQYGSLEEISTGSVSIASEPTLARDIDVNEEDVWSAVPFEQYDASPNRTWEQFGNKAFQEPSPYFSESTREVWNSVWARGSASDGSTETPSIRHDHAIRCLINLGMGLSSDMFTFDDTAHAFPRAAFTFTGLSSELSLSVMRTIGQCGESIRAIERFANLQQISENVSRPMSAIASAANKILTIVRQYLLECTYQVSTILAVQDVFRRPCELLTKLEGVLKRLQNLKDEKSMINYLVQAAEGHECNEQWFYTIMLQVLSLSAQALLEEISNAIGLCQNGRCPNFGTSLLQLDNETRTQDVEPDNRKLPNIFDLDQERIIIHIHQGLKSLQARKPNHVLANPTVLIPQKDVSLSLALSWEDIHDLQVQADNYETWLHSNTNQDQVKTRGYLIEVEDVLAPLINPYALDFALFGADTIPASGDAAMTESCGSSDGLANAVRSVLQGDPTTVSESQLHIPLTVLTSESFTPLLSVQSQQVNQACLAMLFDDCNLLHHLDLLYRYNLLGSGIFTTKLKQALFSSELDSAEHREGHYRSGQLGLRLGSRSTWPPASAELRLALMGILSDCYVESFPQDVKHNSGDLPGGLAFSVRNLSEPDIQACMDPTSLAALDFLRIQYQPDHALAGIFHEEALNRYDLVLKFLLRVSRVSFEVDQTYLRHQKGGHHANASTHRFLFEVRHFVQTLVTYTHSTIAATWTKFNSIVVSIRDDLRHDKVMNASSRPSGMFEIIQLHDLMLRDIMSNLLLKHRHAKAMRILEGILTGILQSVSSHVMHAGPLNQFRANSVEFFTVCQNISDRNDQSQARDVVLPDYLRKAWSSGASSNTGLQSLLTALDMNGWYSKQASK